MNRLGALQAETNRFGTARGGQYFVSRLFQDFLGQAAHNVFVFDEQNSLGAGGQRGLRHPDLVLFRRYCPLRQIDLEGCPMTGLTIDPDVAAALFHDAIDSRYSPCSSLALLFGREKWIED